jgi:hypothetical protein
MEGVMDRKIARLNIEHYRKLLADEKDETRRQTVVHLLAEEESKLAELERLARGIATHAVKTPG